MKKRFIFAILLAGVLSIPAFAAEPVSAKELGAQIEKIRENRKIRRNRWDQKAIHADLKAFYQANRERILSDAGVSYLFFMQMLDNAGPLEEDVYFNETLDMIKAANASVTDEKAKQKYINLYHDFVSRKLGRYTMKVEYDRSAKLYQEHRDKFSPHSIMRFVPGQIFQTLRFTGDMKKVDEYLNTLFTIKDNRQNLREDQVLAFENERQSRLSDAIGKVIEYDPVLGEPLFNKYGTGFSDIQKGVIYAAFCKAAIAAKDRDMFDRMLTKLEALQDGSDKFEQLREVAAAAGHRSVSHALLDRLLAKKDLPVAERFMTVVAKISYPAKFNYQFYSPGEYAKQKKRMVEALTLLRTIPVKDRRHQVRFRRHLQFLSSATDSAFGFGDYAFAAELAAELMLEEKNPQTLWQIRTAEALRQNKLKEAQAVIADILAMPKLPEKTKRFFAPIGYFLNGGDFDGFDKAMAEFKFTSPEKIKAIREVTNLYFLAKKFEDARSLNQEIYKKMYRPAETDRQYTVRYLKNAPKTAEAWARSADYQNWGKMETRFMVYAGYECLQDALLLKDTPAEKLKLNDAKRVGLHIVYDELGVHIYTRINDPDVNEVNLGKRKGASLEWMFRPGDEYAYHSFYFRGIPDNFDIHYVNWAAPTKNYRLTYDGIAKDSVTTPEGYAAHVFIPWLMVYDRLPSEKNIWRLGLQVSNNGDFRTLSGLVHEIQRALQLKFEMTAAQRTALERTICIQAFNRYNNIRRDPGGMIQNWNDYLLGEPEFYKQELEGLLAELDEAGKRLMAPAPDGDIHELFIKYAPQWAEINYIIDDKRTAYLKKGLFTE